MEKYFFVFVPNLLAIRTIPFSDLYIFEVFMYHHFRPKSHWPVFNRQLSLVEYGFQRNHIKADLVC